MIALRIPDAVRRLAGAVLFLAGVAVFCWILAHWTWRMFEPVQARRAITPVTDWSTAILSGPALGFSRAEPGPALNVVAASAPTFSGRVRLLGIAREAATPDGGQALFRVDQKRILWIKVGEALEPGIVLAAVEPNGVRLSQNGQEVRLPLREPRPAPPRSAPAALAARTPATTPAVAARAPVNASDPSCKLTQEQRTRAYVLRPEIIDTVMRERTGWSELFKPTAEGLIVLNPGGTGAMLGLYGNDLLVHADGARLAGAEDVLRLVLQPLARNESVVVSGARGGQPREWIFTGMNCAPR
ncbi:MAG: type II secretion system protein N [Betaproteobacteria bacterium]